MTDRPHKHPDPSDLPDPQSTDGTDVDMSSEEAARQQSIRESRRRFFKIGIAVAPVVLTLQNRSAWADDPQPGSRGVGFQSNFYESSNGGHPDAPLGHTHPLPSPAPAPRSFDEQLDDSSSDYESRWGSDPDASAQRDWWDSSPDDASDEEW